MDVLRIGTFSILILIFFSCAHFYKVATAEPVQLTTPAGYSAPESIAEIKKAQEKFVSVEEVNGVPAIRKVTSKVSSRRARRRHSLKPIAQR